MRTVRPWLFVFWIASLTVVAFGSLTPGSGAPQPFPGADVVQHLVAYAWLAGLALKVFQSRGAAFTAAWGMILYGAALEVAQRFVPGRQPSLGDMAVNLLGVCIGVFVGHQLKLREYDRALAAMVRERRPRR